MWELDLVLDFCTKTVLYVPVVFRSSGIVILFLLCWGLNLRGFAAFGIPCRRVLTRRSTATLTTTTATGPGGAAVGTVAQQADQVFAGVRLLTGILVVCYLLYELCGLYAMEFGQSVTLVLFWFVLVALCTLSPQKLFRDLRGFLRMRLRRLVGAKAPEFVDVLAADVLTSMSKLLADMEVVLCAVFCLLFQNTEQVQSACMHSLVGPLLASVPYAIRAYQCLLSYQATGSTLQLVNFGKYMSAFPVIWTSALKHALAPVEGVALDKHDEHLQILWLYAVTINTLYSFVWDVAMDWGLALEKDSKYPLLRSDMRYGNPMFYYGVIVIDLTLRWCWSMKLSSHLQRHATGKAFVFLFEILEVFRRFLWNFFRVEWEVIKTEAARGADKPPLPLSQRSLGHGIGTPSSPLTPRASLAGTLHASPLSQAELASGVQIL